MYTIEFHKATIGMNLIMPRHLPDCYDVIKRKFDTIAPGNQIFFYIKKIK